MTTDPAPSSDPRRKVARVSAFLAVELSSKAKSGRCGVTRNASGKGLLIVTPSRFAVGDQLDLAVHAGKSSGRVGGRIVRIEENAPDSPEIWRYRLAVELEGSLPQELIDEARARDPWLQAGAA
jgi:hypothetical protein